MIKVLLKLRMCLLNPNGGNIWIPLFFCLRERERERERDESVENVQLVHEPFAKLDW